MINDQQLVYMDRRNVVFSVVQDRQLSKGTVRGAHEDEAIAKLTNESKTQTFTPTFFTMSNQQTAEKSVQTQDSAGSTTLLLSNHPENTATEVANTLVSMATGRQRGTTTVKQINVMSVPNQTVTSSSSSSLPILSLADYTTSRGVPTATALANQAKITPRKQDSMLQNNEEDDDVSMSTDEYDQTGKYPNGTKNSRRGKKTKGKSTSKNRGSLPVETIQYGPILVKPRKRTAPTLSNGRKSKDEPLPPEEDTKRKQRRDRNKQAAAKCRRKRNELRDELEKAEQALLAQQLNLQLSVQNLSDQRNQLEHLLTRHPCLNKTHLSMAHTTVNNLNLAKNDLKTIPTSALLDPNNTKRVTINFSNAQDLFSVAPLTRSTSTADGSSTSGSSVPMITIHIIPEVAQALLGSTTVDKTRLAELLQQANTINITSSTTDSTNSTN